MNRADHFGLAQLYQLRGRVGRSHRRAYCYLLVPDAVDPGRGAPAPGARAPHRARRGLSRSRSRTWSCAAPATCSAPSSPASCTRSASTSTSACSTRRCSGCMRGDERAEASARRRLDGHARLSPRRLHRRRRRPSSTSTAGSTRYDDAGGDRGAARRAARPVRPAPGAGRGHSSRWHCCGWSGARSGSRGSWCAATKPVLPFGIPRCPA